jgi:F-type H+-transporting ATPase subunit delta
VATAAARRYGKAIFELAQSDGDLDGWARRLARVREILGDPQVADVLSNPTIATEQREALIGASPRVLDDEGTNLARLLIESGRTSAIAEIEEEFTRLSDQAAGRVRATVTTAIEMKPADRARVERELSQRLKKEVRMTVAVDPRIIGGLKLQYGDHVVDASVATKLQQLRRRLAAS